MDNETRFSVLKAINGEKAAELAALAQVRVGRNQALLRHLAAQPGSGRTGAPAPAPLIPGIPSPSPSLPSAVPPTP